MSEKVMYVALPEGTKYQRVIQTKDGRIGIVYTKERDHNETYTPGENKPIPPIGGTDVFQIPETGTSYWYSKLKGRDLFMYLQFADITEDDLLFDANGKKREFSSCWGYCFKEKALQAIEQKPAEGFRWIPAFEPSMSENGDIQYVPGYDPLVNIPHRKWQELFKNYSSENGSHEATITTCFLLFMRWLKDGIVTMEQLEKPVKIGHFMNSGNQANKAQRPTCEKTGARQFGGLYGFIGNTCKEVIDWNSPSNISTIGGCCYNYSWNCTAFSAHYIIHSDDADEYNVGLLELTK